MYIIYIDIRMYIIYIYVYMIPVQNSHEGNWQAHMVIVLCGW